MRPDQSVVARGLYYRLMEREVAYDRPYDVGLLKLFHHPHVLHGVEWYRQRPILYSLGNYLFHRLIVGQQPQLQRSYPPYDWSSLRSADNLDSVVARVTLTGTDGVDLDMVPVVLDARGEPQAAGGDDARRIRGRIAAFSERFATTVEATENGMRLASR